MKSRTKNLILAAITLVVVVCGIAGAKYLTEVNRYRKSVAEISISDVDIGGIPDGDYEGACDVGFIRAKVSVSVKNGRITDLKLLEHKNDRGDPAEKLVGDILSEQTLGVDTVVGATNSSKVIIKAVENALLRGD